jgi:hypothetical protein
VLQIHFQKAKEVPCCETPDHLRLILFLAWVLLCLSPPQPHRRPVCQCTA